MSSKGSMESVASQASESARFWIPATIVAMVVIYFILKIIFGGMGGHRFSLFSKLSFLESTSNNYYASEADLARARAAWRQGNSDATIDSAGESRSPTSTTEADKSKNGVILYARDYEKNQNSDAQATAGAQVDGNSTDSQAPVSSDSEDDSTDPPPPTEDLTAEEIDEALQQGEKVISDVDEKAQRIKELAGEAENPETDLKEVPEDNSEAIENTSNDIERNNTDAFSFDQPSFRSKPITHAFNVRINTENPANCYGLEAAQLANIYFRQGRSAIKSFSLNGLDVLIDLHRACSSSQLVIEANPNAPDDSEGNTGLYQRRRDEIRYYLLQRRVQKEAIAMKEDS